jgi:hypothetical protein
MNMRDMILIEAFCRRLGAQGSSLKSAGRHKDNLNFFAHSFLEPSEGMELKEVDAETIQYFLESWYPTKVKSSRSELLRLIASFRKFYKFLFEISVINRESREEIMAVLSRKNHILTNFAVRKNQRPEILAGGFPAPGPATSPDPAFWIDQGLYLLAHNLEKPSCQFVLDFQVFLDYLIQHHVRLSPSTATFPKKDLRRINQSFKNPEQLPATAGQEQSRRLTMFYRLGRSLDLFVVGSEMELLVTPRAEHFLELDLDSQFVVLLDALWNRVRWSELQSFGAQGLAGWAQEHRNGFAELLSRLAVGVDPAAPGAPPNDRNLKMLSNYLTLFEAVENLIMFSLKELGMLEYRFKPGRDQHFYRNHRGIESISLTKFGKKIMKYLARKGRDETGGDSLIDLMEDGLIFL